MQNRPPQHSDEEIPEEEIDTDARLYALESAFIAMAYALVESGALQANLLVHHLQSQADKCDRRGIRDSAQHLDLIAQCCVKEGVLTRLRPASPARPRGDM
jgi:hypothetical protein